MLHLLVLALLAAVAFSASSDSNTFRHGPPTVPELNMQAYSGYWYQTHASKLPLMLFEKDAYCVTANYNLTSPTVFDATSSWRKGAPTGPLMQHNYTLTQSSDPGKFKMHCAKMPMPGCSMEFMKGLYWVIMLGPVDPATNLYTYTAISGPLGAYVMIYARDVEQFKSEYEATVLAQLAGMGFTTPFNSPLPVYQGSDCLYV